MDAPPSNSAEPDSAETSTSTASAAPTEPAVPASETGSETRSGEDERKLDRAVSELYVDLRRLASAYVQRDRDGLTLSATDLVHETYRRLAASGRLEWNDQGHFLALAATAMRRLLIEQARRRSRHKRGGGWQRVTLDPRVAGAGEALEGPDLLALDEALHRLAELDSRQARVVEMRFFSGMELADIARVLGVTRRTVDRDWAHARSWLRRELASEAPRGTGP